MYSTPGMTGTRSDQAAEGKSSLGVLPFLEGLASECAAAKETFALQRPHFVEHFKSEERQDPKITTLAYVLMDKEHEVLNSLVTALPEAGLQLVAPLFDGAIVRPADLSDLWGEWKSRVKNVSDVVMVKHQIRVREKPFQIVVPDEKARDAQSV